MNTFFRPTVFVTLSIALATLPALFAQTPTTAPLKVTIDEDKTEISDRVLPLDPVIRVAYEYVGSMSFGVNGEGKRLTCGAGSAHTVFKIDGQVFYPDALPGNFNKVGGGMPGQDPLPPGPNGKKRTGMQTTWTHGDIKVTMILEVVPGKPYEKNAAAPQKKRMDTLLIKYVIENNGANSHQVGARMYIDTMCGNNDGAIFASPTTHPGVLLDGVMLEGEKVPEFIEMLEKPNLQNPGFKGIFTFKMGKQVEPPNKIVLTGLGAFGGDWDVPAVQAMGDSAAAFFWDPKEVKSKAKREIAFAIGQGIATNPESEGKVATQFSGNFEPNKEFTVTAYIEDPIDGQNLTLELPKGMERVGGKATQTVPTPNGAGQSVVMWKARVVDLGTHELRIRSSNGVTYTRTITVSRP